MILSSLRQRVQKVYLSEEDVPRKNKSVAGDFFGDELLNLSAFVIILSALFLKHCRIIIRLVVINFCFAPTGLVCKFWLSISRSKCFIAKSEEMVILACGRWEAVENPSFPLKWAKLPDLAHSITEVDSVSPEVRKI